MGFILEEIVPEQHEMLPAALKGAVDRGTRSNHDYAQNLEN
jgi:hypothetical protein